MTLCDFPRVGQAFDSQRHELRVQHVCNLELGHDGKHHCVCGFDWPQVPGDGPQVLGDPSPAFWTGRKYAPGTIPPPERAGEIHPFVPAGVGVCRVCGLEQKHGVHALKRPQDTSRREIPVQTPETDRAELADIMRRHTRRFVLYVSVIAEDPADDGRREHTLPFLNERISLESRAVAEALFEHLAGQVKLAGFFKPVLDKAP